jgi:hypothetical protein
MDTRSESSSTSPLQMTLLEGRVGGDGEGAEVSTMTARYAPEAGSLQQQLVISRVIFFPNWPGDI